MNILPWFLYILFQPGRLSHFRLPTYLNNKLQGWKPPGNWLYLTLDTATAPPILQFSFLTWLAGHEAISVQSLSGLFHTHQLPPQLHRKASPRFYLCLQLFPHAPLALTHVFRPSFRLWQPAQSLVFGIVYQLNLGHSVQSNFSTFPH